MFADHIIWFYEEALFGLHLQFTDKITIRSHQVQTQIDGGDDQAKRI